jgi:hypothetical protein
MLLRQFIFRWRDLLFGWPETRSGSPGIPSRGNSARPGTGTARLTGAPRDDDLLNRTAKIGLPPKSEPIMIDVAEFIALKAIVTRMLAEMAVAQESSGGLQAQTWINELAESCTDMISYRFHS